MADEPIDPRELIAAYRAVARPSVAVKRRIARTIGAPVRAPRWPYVALAVAAAALLVASLSWRASWLDRSPRERARPEAQYEDAAPAQLGRLEPGTAPHAVVVATPSGGSVEPRPVEIQRAATPEPSERKSSSRRDPPSRGRDPTTEPDGDDLLAEMALLERARSKLATGRPGDALAIVEEHARTFPAGALGEERDALRVIAWCGLPERANAALAARTAFARDYPRSTYAERVRRACVHIGASSGTVGTDGRARDAE